MRAIKVQSLTLILGSKQSRVKIGSDKLSASNSDRDEFIMGKPERKSKALVTSSALRESATKPCCHPLRANLPRGATGPSAPFCFQFSKIVCRTRALGQPVLFHRSACASSFSTAKQKAPKAGTSTLFRRHRIGWHIKASNSIPLLGDSGFALGSWPLALLAFEHSERTAFSENWRYYPKKEIIVSLLAAPLTQRIDHCTILLRTVHLALRQKDLP